LLAVTILLFGGRPPASAQPQSITLDGLLDDGAYTLLAQDPSNDTAAVFSSAPTTAWTDLTALYVATDTANLYVYAVLPGFINGTSAGEIGLAIDTTGDVPNSGGPNDPWGNAVTYSYTSTHNNISTTAQSTLNTVRPDIVIRGKLIGTPADSDVNDGQTDLQIWNGSNWVISGTNWGGLSGSLIGTHIAYAAGHGVELAIPFADLGVAPTATLNLQFYTSRHGAIEGAYGAIDTVPSDDQSPIERSATVERQLATWPFPAPPPPPTPTPPPPTPTPPPPGPCDPAALADGAVVVAGLEHLDTDPAYRSPTGTLQPGQSVTLTLRTCAADITAASVLVWNPGDTLNSPAHTYPLTLTAAPPDFALWQVVIPPQPIATDRLYEFQLTDAGTTSYFHAASGDTGPGQWSAALQSNRWRLAVVPAAPPPPLQWRLYLPNLNR
jgi:hypothetical protein